MRNVAIVLASAVAYAALTMVWVPGLEKDGTFFIGWLVTFLHELGHVVAALLTGGGATQMVLFPDDPGLAGYACTHGGFRPAVLMGGYIGSALFGCFFLYSAFRQNLFSRYCFRGLAVVMVASQVLWFPYGECAGLAAGLRDAVVSVGFCLVGAVALWYLSRLPYGARNTLLIFVGAAMLLDVLRDVFRLGYAPHSDLHVFTQQLSVKGFVLIPLLVWQVVWVGIIVAIMGWSLRMAYRSDRHPTAATVSGPSARGGGE